MTRSNSIKSQKYLNVFREIDETFIFQTSVPFALHSRYNKNRQDVGYVFTSPTALILGREYFFV